MIADFIAKTRSERFQWGVNDCALWCSSAVEHETGIDPASDLRGKYSTRFQCNQIIMEAGGLEKLIAPRMSSFQDIASDGVAILKVDGRKICGLIVDGRAILRMQNGLQVTDNYTVLRGWSWLQR